jgi:hypothetical protein
MDLKPVKTTIRCGIYHINKKKKHIYTVPMKPSKRRENPRIHSGYTQGYLKINELFSRQQVFLNREE